jgi:signal transduction histidine kinase
VSSVDQDGRRMPLVELALYRIAQEALNNVVHHAKITAVFITFEDQTGVG